MTGSLRRPQQRPGSSVRLITGALASQHCRELGRSFIGVEDPGVRVRPSIKLVLADHDVRIRVRGDLRQMRDAEHLMIPAQRAKPLPQRRCIAAADASVDLVEHEQWRFVGRGQDDLERQRQPAGLAARRDPGERPWWLTRIRGKGEGDTVRAIGRSCERVALNPE